MNFKQYILTGLTFAGLLQSCKETENVEPVVPTATYNLNDLRTIRFNLDGTFIVVADGEGCANTLTLALLDTENQDTLSGQRASSIMLCKITNPDDPEADGNMTMTTMSSGEFFDCNSANTIDNNFHGVPIKNTIIEMTSSASNKSGFDSKLQLTQLYNDKAMLTEQVPLGISINDIAPFASVKTFSFKLLNDEKVEEYLKNRRMLKIGDEGVLGRHDPLLFGEVNKVSLKP